jgi:hypothetical protein
MNPKMRLTVLFVFAAAFVAAAAPRASGRQVGRPMRGNSAEIERVERERREREMRERDLRERQFLLRTARPEIADPAAKQPALRLAVAQIREDFARIQVVNNELAKATARGGALDLKFVARSASEIKKLAARLKENLALPEPEPDAKSPAPRLEQLTPTLSALDKLVLGFADNLSSWGVKQVDARSAAGARRELDAIIELSGWVKKTSEKMDRAIKN